MNESCRGSHFALHVPLGVCFCFKREYLETETPFHETVSSQNLHPLECLIALIVTTCDLGLFGIELYLLSIIFRNFHRFLCYPVSLSPSQTFC